MKTPEDKKKLIQQIRKTPIIQIACERAGISRATYYRWKKSDTKLPDQAEEALLDGIALINDMAESQLISGIRDKNLTAIIFWLKNHHKAYKNKVEVSGSIKTADEALTPEQQKLIKNAIKLAAAGDDNNH